MWRLVCLFLFLSCQIISGLTVTLDQGTSPNGKYFLTIEESPDGFTDTLQVRQRIDQKVVGSFEWSQFYPHLTPKSAGPLWRSDSSAFALSWEMSRGWSGSEVFVLQNGSWYEIQPPLERLGDHYHWQSRGKGWYSAIAWVPGNVLKMFLDDGEYRFDANGQTILAPNLWVYLEIVPSKPAPQLRVAREEISPNDETR